MLLQFIYFSQPGLELYAIRKVLSGAVKQILKKLHVSLALKLDEPTLLKKVDYLRGEMNGRIQ